MKKQWSITALEAQLPSYLGMCHTQFERDNVIAFHGIEVRKLASEKTLYGKKLTPAEIAIAEKYGWRKAQ